MFIDQILLLVCLGSQVAASFVSARRFCSGMKRSCAAVFRFGSEVPWKASMP